MRLTGGEIGVLGTESGHTRRKAGVMVIVEFDKQKGKVHHRRAKREYWRIRNHLHEECLPQNIGIVDDQRKSDKALVVEMFSTILPKIIIILCVVEE